MDILKEDTIAAIATPFGTGGTGKIRISGPQAYQIGDKIFKSVKKEKNLKNKKHIQLIMEKLGIQKLIKQ